MTEQAFLKRGKRPFKVDVVCRYPEFGAVRILRNGEEWIVKDSEVITAEDYQAEQKQKQVEACAEKWKLLIKLVKNDTKDCADKPLDWEAIGLNVGLPAGAAWWVVHKCKRLGLL